MRNRPRGFVAHIRAAIAWRVERVVDSRNYIGDVLNGIASYRRQFGRVPNLIAPRRFSEHIVRLMLSPDGRSEFRARVADKEFVKELIRERAGAEFVIPTIAVLRDMKEFDAFAFPADCVVKPTHLSGHVVVRQNGAPAIDRNLVRRWFATNYYDRSREPVYRRLLPKVLVEERIDEPGRHVPLDYKVFCFRGVPAFIQVDEGRFVEHRREFYSPAWRRLPFLIGYPALKRAVARPARLDDMLDAAARLSRDMSYMRVDFYAVGDALKVGELTNFPDAGLPHFDPPQADAAAGRFFSNPTLDAEVVFAGLAPLHPDAPVHKHADDTFLAPLAEDTHAPRS